MGRIITAIRMQEIEAARTADPDAPGPALAMLIIEGNIPVEAVASMLNVSEPTIYRWMYGQSKPKDIDKIAKVKRLLTVLRKAKRAKDLPLSGTMQERVKATAALVIKHKPVARVAS